MTNKQREAFKKLRAIVATMRPGELVWARKRLPEGSVSWGKFAEPRWHRIASVNDTAILAACHRVVVGPLDLLSEVPHGSFSCRSCTGAAATARANAPLELTREGAEG